MSTTPSGYWFRFPARRPESMIFQGAMNALNPVRSVADQIVEAIQVHLPDLSKDEANHRALNLLELVGIDASRGREYPHQFSGGMRQRAMIALALSCDPVLVVADEPTTALDVMIQAQIIELLSRIRRELGMALVLITHDLGVVAETCDWVVVMYGGIVAEQGSVEDVYSNPQHPYTKLLLEAFPDVDQPERLLVSIRGVGSHHDARLLSNGATRSSHRATYSGRDAKLPVSCWIRAR